MIVVADTTPLNYLIQLGYADILQVIYGRVLVPAAVISEMQHPDTPASVRIWAFSPPEWLEIKKVEHLDRSLPVELGGGEREAISLALEVNATVLLIDELAGRREAQIRNLQIAGTLAVLQQGDLRGYLDFVSAMRKLRSLGFWLSATAEASVLELYRRAKNTQAQ